MNIADLKKSADGMLILSTLKRYELLEIDAPSFEVKRIASGAINRNYKVYDGHSSLLFKVFSENQSLPIDRQQVFKMQEELAILGLAPTPLYLSEDASAYCEEWIEVPTNEILLQNDQSKLSKAELFAEILYNVHSSFVSAPLIALDEHWAIYWQKIQVKNAQIEQQYQFAKVQWTNYLDKYRDDFVLCHNDLHIEHISYPHGPVFDWEYAGLGCRYFDIASCCAINQLTHNEIISLCECYAHLANKTMQEILDRVQETSSLVSFTYELWSRSIGLEQDIK